MTSQAETTLRRLVREVLYNPDYPPRVALLLTFEILMYINVAIVTIYAIICGTHPTNAFLSAVFGPLGLGVLAMALRFQLIDSTEKQKALEKGGEEALQRKKIFSDIPEHRAFVEYTLGSVLVLLATYTFMG